MRYIYSLALKWPALIKEESKTKFLKLYTIYSPPEHMDKVIRKTKKEALAQEEHFDGKPTE